MVITRHPAPDDRVDAASYIMDFEQIGSRDVGRVGGKNAALGELFRAMKPKGVGVLDGFAATASAYRRLLRERGLVARLEKIFAPSTCGHRCGETAWQADRYLRPGAVGLPRVRRVAGP